MGSLVSIVGRVGSFQPGRGRRIGRFARARVAAAGAAFLLIVLVAAILAQWLQLPDPNAQSLASRFRGPSWAHALGTDHLGRDVLSRVVYASRLSLLVGAASTLLAAAVGITLGLLSGFYGGRLDDLVSWVTNVQLAFPFLLLAIAVVAFLGPGLANLVLVLALGGWVSYSRVTRAKVLEIRERAFVEAARAAGASDRRVMLTHILVNSLTPLIVLSLFEVARVIVGEAALSFLGLGVGVATPSWGTMLAEGKDYLARAWWASTFPGLAIMLTVFSMNLVGDGLRDALDPRLRM